MTTNLSEQLDDALTRFMHDVAAYSQGDPVSLEMSFKQAKHSLETSFEKEKRSFVKEVIGESDKYRRNYTLKYVMEIRNKYRLELLKRAGIEDRS